MPDSEKVAVAPESQKETSGLHWSKDYVEHLRTVHFSLIALSLAALVISSSPNPNDIIKAREQINAIGDLAHNWNPSWLLQPAEKAIVDCRKDLALPKEVDTKLGSIIEQPQDANAVILTDASGRQTTYSVKFSSPNWIIEGPVRRYRHRTIESFSVNEIREINLDVPKTLEEFRSLWNTLNERHDIRIPVELSKNVYAIAWNAGEAKYTSINLGTLQWVKLAPEMLTTKPGVTLTLDPFKDRVKGALPREWSEHAYFAYSNNMLKIEFVIPVINDEDCDFKPQAGLIDQLVKAYPARGSFEHSFPELNKITKNYQSLEIDRFDPILEAEQNRTGETFEAFGIKFPADATTRWGILVILAVQLYFWIHLRELARKLLPTDPGWEVAFIGMYPSFPSQFVYLISVLFFPVSAIAALGIRGLFVGSFHWQYWLLCIAGIALSLVLAALTWQSAPSRSVGGKEGCEIRG